jgi:hypothetical protein
MRYCYRSNKGTASDFVQISEKCDRDPGNIYTSVRRRKYEPYIESPNSPRLKKARQVKSKVVSACSLFSLISRGLSTKNSFWQARQSIPHTTVTFYGDCMKIGEDFAPNFGIKRTGYFITTMHHLILSFSPGNLWPKTT